MEHLKKFIKQIQGRDYSEGCGVLIDNYLITAGHVAHSKSEPYILYDGEKIELTNPIIESDEKDPNKLDLAIYHIPGLTSDIKLSDKNPHDKEPITVMGYIDQMSDPKFIISKGRIFTDLTEGNYYTIETDEQLKAGCSGSPIFQKEKLVGIIIRGNRDNQGNPVIPGYSTKLCMVLSCEAITKALE